MALTQLLRADPHYHDHGDGEPVVLVHGLFANLQLWAPIAGPLAQSHRAVTYDLPGHGQAPAVTSIEMSGLVENLETLLDQLQIAAAHLGGISLGAMIALRFTLDRPERVATLTLADGFAGRLEDQYLDVFAGHARLAMDQGMQALFDHVLAHPALPIGPGLDLSPQTYEAHRQEFLKNRPATLAAYVAMMQRQQDWTPELAGVKTPTLLIAGDLDLPSIPHMKAMHEALAGSELHLIPNCGHTSAAERPRDFLELLRDFLLRHPLAVES